MNLHKKVQLSDVHEFSPGYLHLENRLMFNAIVFWAKCIDKYAFLSWITFNNLLKSIKTGRSILSFVSNVKQVLKIKGFLPKNHFRACLQNANHV